MTDFAGLRAVVTGGAQGIGLAAASLLASRGARVVVFDLKPDVSEPLTGIAADVTDRHYWLFQIIGPGTGSSPDYGQRDLPGHYRHGPAPWPSDQRADLRPRAKNSIGTHWTAGRPGWACRFPGERCGSFHYGPDTSSERRKYHVVRRY